jgi:hypothetical protein
LILLDFDRDELCKNIRDELCRWRSGCGFAVVESRDDLTPLYRVGLVVLLLTLLKTGSAIVACGIALPGTVLLELIAEEAVANFAMAAGGLPVLVASQFGNYSQTTYSFLEK